MDEDKIFSKKYIFSWITFVIGIILLIPILQYSFFPLINIFFVLCCSPFTTKFAREKNFNESLLVLCQCMLLLILFICSGAARISGTYRAGQQLQQQQIIAETSSTQANQSSVVLYDENDIKVTYTGMEKVDNKIKMNLLITNGTDKSIGVMSTELSVNGLAVEDIFSSGVASGKEINDSINIDFSSLEKNGINPDDVETVGFQFCFFDTNNSSDVFYSKSIKLNTISNMVDFEEIEMNTESTTSPETTTEPETIPETTEPPTEDVTEPETEAQTEKSVETTSKMKVDNNFISNHDSQIIAAATLALENFITDYDMSLAPQRWTIAPFDDNDTVMTTVDISYNGKSGKYIYVGTLEINQKTGRIDSAQPHFLYVIDTVLGDDGYCDDFFEKINALG